MKRYGHLFEKIVSFDNLLSAAKKSLRGKKHKPRAAAFYFNLENEIIAIREDLESRNYTPYPLRIFFIKEPKVRKIGAAHFRDRVVHHAVCNILEPVFEKRYIYRSYACRVGKGTHRAIAEAQKYCRKYRDGYFLKCDIRKYFENIDHRILKDMLSNTFKDPELLWLLDIVIDSSDSAGKGIPIGNLTSQHFANFYMDKLDHYIKDVLRVKAYLRYMDDFILFGNDKRELRQLEANISDFLYRRLRLQIKEKSILVAPCITGVPFLGFRIFPGIIRIKHENKKRWIKKLKRRLKEFESGKIDEQTYASCLNSMSQHIKTADSYCFRRSIFNGK